MQKGLPDIEIDFMFMNSSWTVMKRPLASTDQVYATVLTAVDVDTSCPLAVPVASKIADAFVVKSLLNLLRGSDTMPAD